ncbi:hypothetical protein JCM10213_006302 [Rhodosporidiobolus nylandii]
MPVLGASLVDPDFSPLRPHSSPVTTHPYPAWPPFSGTAATAFSSASKHSGAGGAPVLAIVLPVLLGSLFLFGGLYALMRWNGKP